MRLKLKYWRNKKVMTILELSLKAKVSTQTIVKIEKLGHYPKPLVIKKLAQALGIEPTELVLDDEIKPEDKVIKSSRKRKVVKKDKDKQ